MYINSSSEWTEATYPNWLFSIIPKDDGMLEDSDKNGETKNTLSFKGRVLKTLP
jgi:hypothetical protein